MSKWIKCKQKFPEDDRLVLAFDSKFQDIIYAHCLLRDGKKREWVNKFGEHFGGHKFVTHWMPMPKKPKEKKDE